MTADSLKNFWGALPDRVGSRAWKNDMPGVAPGPCLRRYCRDNVMVCVRDSHINEALCSQSSMLLIEIR
jgi:hypothetical protein